jgi:aminoglycoside phosphotransferase (APT) family kinase protein
MRRECGRPSSRHTQYDSTVEGILGRSPVLRDGEIQAVYLPKLHSCTGSTVVKVVANGRNYCLRISRGKANYAGEKDNIDYLKRKGVDDSKLPDIVEVGRCSGFEYSVIPFYRGVSTKSNIIVRKAIRKLAERRLFQSLAEDLIQLAHRTMSRNTLCFEETVERVISEYLDECDSAEIVRFLSHAIAGIKPVWDAIPVVFEHDDFQIGNIIITGISPLGYKIIDWESGTRYGFPSVDLYNLLKSRGIKDHRIASVLSDYCERVGADMAVVPYLIAIRFLSIRRNWKASTSSGHLSPREWKRRDARLAYKMKALISLA